MTGIDELRKTLEGSAILASKQHRVKVLLDVIAKYCFHAQAIGAWLKQWVRQKYRSPLNNWHEKNFFHRNNI